MPQEFILQNRKNLDFYLKVIVFMLPAVGECPQFKLKKSKYGWIHGDKISRQQCRQLSRAQPHS